MFCSRCGAHIAPGSAFCTVCGTKVAPDGQAAVTRPAIVTILAVLQFIGAAFCCLAGLTFVAVALFAGDEDLTGLLVAGLILLGLAALQLTCGVGLWRLRPYGRTIQLVLAWIGLLGIPVGTVISILILLYLYKPGIKLLFSGRAQATFTPEEQAQVARVSGESHAAIIITVVGLVFVGIVVLPIVAAIAIPGFLRARMSANEASAISTIRQVISAEVAYSTVNGGLYDKPECLASPVKCVPGYSGTAFLDADGASVVSKTGYHFEFRPGETVGADEIRRRSASPTSVAEFAYVAAPITPGTTGVRVFCGDSSGEVVVIAPQEAADVTGRCPPGSPVR
jgi:hypothetical protein